MTTIERTKQFCNHEWMHRETVLGDDFVTVEVLECAKCDALMSRAWPTVAELLRGIEECRPEEITDIILTNPGPGQTAVAPVFVKRKR